MDNPPESLGALCALAFAFGAHHGFDADHLATIDALARRSAEDKPKLARLVGILFSGGHGAVVLAIAMVASLAASTWTTPAWLEVSGLAISVAFLFALAFLNLRMLLATPAGQAVIPTGFKTRLFRRVLSVRTAPGVAGVGALFALSFDTVSQAALFAVLASNLGGWPETLIAATCFIGGMMLVDGLNGRIMAALVTAASRRAILGSRIMTGVIATIGLAVGSILLVKLASPAISVWLDESGEVVSALVLLLVGLAAIVSAGLGWAGVRTRRSI